MKKRIALLLGTVLMVSGILAGCGGTGDRVATKDETTTQAQQEETKTEGVVKTGLAMIPTVDSSTDAGDEEGLAQANISIAAVTVDADGKVLACVIDAAQVKINFGKDGKLVTALDTEFPTKQELGEGYGMKAASSVGKEWNEQADAFAAFCVGKTSDEITGMEVTEDGLAADADLAASCTLHPGNFQYIVAKAIANATEGGAQATDKLGLGVVTNIAKSKDAGDEDGLAQAYTTVTAVTTDADGKITSAVIDAVQANVNFDATGKITTDLTAEIQTKNELGEGYGMKGASSIGKEWNEQAAAYAAYAVGKTVEEVNNTAVEEGVPSDADLKASVTVHITDFNTVITKAVENAK